MKKITDVLNKLNVIYDKKQKLKFCFLFVLILISALLEIIGISLIFPFINIVINQEVITAGGKISQIYNFFGLNNIKTFLILISVALIFVYVFKNIYILIVCYFQYKILYSAQKNISLQLISFYLKQPYSYHLEINSSSIIRNLTSDTEQCSEFLVNFFFLLTDFVVCILILFLLFFINKLITAVLIFLFLLIFLGVFGTLKSKLKVYANKNFKNRSEMIKWIQQAFESIKDIKILQKEKFFINQYYDSSSNLLSTQKNFNLLQQLPRLFIETFIIVIIITIIIFLLIKNADTAAMIAQMAVFAMAAFRLAPSLNRMQISLNNMMFFMPALDAVYNALKNKKEKVFIEQDENKQIDLKKEISVNNISFKYKKTNKYVFNNVSFKIKCGNSIGIIGPTGSGKTTILNVILGLLDPTEGTVTVDNFDIHKNKKSWFSKIGYVPQFIYLTNDTIKNNILFYNDEKEDIQQLNKVIEQTHLKDFIDSLPKGIDTIVGERGIRLSGGQRQRIGIARALYNKPQLLVFDEATSSLDNNTEKYIMEAIENLYGKVTIITVAHRLTTIANCDMVFELKNGILNIVKNK